MKKYCIIYILIFSCIKMGFAQSAFQNNGNVQIHNGGKIGFHTNLVNNGNFDENLGLAGFYSKDFLVVSGTNKAIFNTVEIAVDNNLYLETSLGLTNNLSFISGHVITPRKSTNVSLDFMNYNVYAGEEDSNHVNGYVSSVLNASEFVFPIGDGYSLRPMIIPNQIENTTFKGAYFREDPNYPSVFNASFDTSKKQLGLKSINEEEFWDLDGENKTNIVLTWNFESNINTLSTNIRNLRVVGWSKSLEKWVDLGQKSIEGDLEEGKIESEFFVPNNYEVITIGSDSFTESSENHNYGISPNGDGLNDTFAVEGIEHRPNNTIYIFNRWGALVYSKKGYDNSWGGKSDHKLTLNKNEILPIGTYFYILKFHDEHVNWVGYIYLNR